MITDLNAQFFGDKGMGNAGLLKSTKSMKIFKAQLEFINAQMMLKFQYSHDVEVCY